MSWSWLDRFLPSGPIKEGGRHNTLISLAGKLRYRGTDEERIVSILSEVNRDRCVPPLSDFEIRTIARTASSRPPRVTDDNPNRPRSPHTHRFHFFHLDTPGPWEGVQCLDCIDPVPPMDLGDVPRFY